MKNNAQISGKWSKSKPKVDFQYGGRLFFKNGSSYISAINWDMSTKFGLLIDFDLLKAAMSTNAKPEIVLLRFGRHIAFSRWRPRPLNTISGFAFVDIAAFRRWKSISKPNFVEISQKRLRYFYGNPKWLGKGSFFFENQECVNIYWDAIVTFCEYKKMYFLMLVD